MSTQKKAPAPAKPKAKAENEDYVLAKIRKPESRINPETGLHEAVDTPFTVPHCVADWLQFLDHGLSQGYRIVEVLECPEGVPTTFKEAALTKEIKRLNQSLRSPKLESRKEETRLKIKALEDELKTLKTK